MVCEHHPSPRPRPKSQAAGRARARARTRARVRAGYFGLTLAALSVRPSTLRARFAACAMGWSALPYASGFFFAAWQASQHGSCFLPSPQPSSPVPSILTRSRHLVQPRPAVRRRVNDALVALVLLVLLLHRIPFLVRRRIFIAAGLVLAHRLRFAARTTRHHGGRWRWRWHTTLSLLMRALRKRRSLPVRLFAAFFATPLTFHPLCSWRPRNDRKGERGVFMAAEAADTAVAAAAAAAPPQCCCPAGRRPAGRRPAGRRRVARRLLVDLDRAARSRTASRSRPSRHRDRRDRPAHSAASMRRLRGTRLLGRLAQLNSGRNPARQAAWLASWLAKGLPPPAGCPARAALAAAVLLRCGGSATRFCG